MVNRKALLVGVTGLVGRHLLDEILRDDFYDKVIVLSRRPLGLDTERLEERVIDFNTIEEACKDIFVRDVFCCLGTTMKKAGSKENFKLVDFHYPIRIAKALKHNGVKQYLIVTSIGANSESSFFYNRIKGDVENEISRIGFEGLQILRPSLLLGERSERRIGEMVGKWMADIFSFAFFGPFDKYKAIEGSQVSMGMYKIAREFPKGINVYESDQIRSL